ncbi:CD0415/CD1112 family protein [Peptoniphilus equinus]|uniref:CD0415/CD1112 family protein n=1 Tax=Peptoniphilus equinus TaxID=3016343 RepID=A0ABY7QRA9_9FIRM|nr:CD0415/CD1112 family protein [Peptoniphilus equinus]WBW49323.1 CD0415/CD1112 family protein [Peptoniphilus equinus]
MQPMSNWAINNITESVSHMADTINHEIGQVGDIVSQTPDGYNNEIFNMAKNINTDIVVPIAVIVITFIAIYSLMNLVMERNNLHDIDTFVFFKWIIVTYVSIWFVTNSFDIVMAIFKICQNMIAGVTNISDATIDTVAYADTLKESLKDKSWFSLAILSGFISMASFIFQGIGILVWVIAVGRMVEIYFTIAVASLPLATMTNHRYSNVGDSYIKQVIALGLQGLFLIMAIAFYSILVQNIDMGGENIFLVMAKIIGYGLLLVMVMLRTKSVARSIVGA